MQKMVDSCLNKLRAKANDLIELAEQGDDNAACRLGDCYFKGSGVVRDIVKAAKWWLLAAIWGSVKAENRLRRHYRCFAALKLVIDKDDWMVDLILRKTYNDVQNGKVLPRLVFLLTPESEGPLSELGVKISAEEVIQKYSDICIKFCPKEIWDLADRIRKGLGISTTLENLLLKKINAADDEKLFWGGELPPDNSGDPLWNDWHNAKLRGEREEMAKILSKLRAPRKAWEARGTILNWRPVLTSMVALPKRISATAEICKNCGNKYLRLYVYDLVFWGSWASHLFMCPHCQKQFSTLPAESVRWEPYGKAFYNHEKDGGNAITVHFNY